METELRGTAHTVYIGSDHPTVLIGERINPTSRKVLAEKLRQGDLQNMLTAYFFPGLSTVEMNFNQKGIEE